MKSTLTRAVRYLLLASTAVSATASVAGGNTGNKDNNYTAHGNQPDWQLEIDNTTHQVRFVTDTEEVNYRYPMAGPSFYRETLTTVYMVPNDQHTMSIRVTEKACRDSATGKSHETTVVVIFDGEGYHGCGDYEHRIAGDY